jgi:hypothetical protein
VSPLASLIEFDDLMTALSLPLRHVIFMIYTRVLNRGGRGIRSPLYADDHP